MEKYSRAVAEKLAADLGYDDEKTEVMAYGAFALFQMFISVGLVLGFGILFHVAAEALIISFTASILRKYSGGVHASSPNTCTFLGVVVCIGFAMIIKFMLATAAGIGGFLAVGLLVFAWALLTLYKLAPVDTPNKPIRSEAKRRRMRKGSFTLLGFYLVLAAACLILSIFLKWDNFFVYSMCITFGVLWQVFTLTSGGHLVIKKLDLFLHKV